MVLEAPISSGYSVKALAEAARRWPGLPVKAVVTTSDSWPHLAGIREYAARGIPIYCLDLNQRIIRRTISAPYTSRPDTQERRPRAPILRPVSERTVLGEGPNRIELYPIRGETSERQMMAYLPGQRLLYGSDPFQQLPDGSLFYPQTVSELRDAAAREHLAPQHFWMMHMGLTPWSLLDKAISAAAARDTPDGDLIG